LGDNLFKTWDAQVRSAYLLGIPAREINRSVLGSIKDLEPGQMQALRRSLEVNTKTMIAEMATEARNETYAKNSSLFSGYRYCGVLDDRQCLICGSVDQVVYKTLEEVPHLPQHRQCRCVAIPEVKGLEGFDEDDERASMDGPVYAGTSYSDWLSKQDAETQLDILGPSRYKMYQSGVKIDSFVEDGRILTLKELEKKL
jgi:hypothetical protein